MAILQDSMIASAFLRLMYGTGYALQALMAVRGGAYGESSQPAAGQNRSVTTALGAAVWAILLVSGSLALV